MKTALLTLLAAALAGGAGAAAFVWIGAYDVSVTAQHTQPVYSMLRVAMSRSVALRARGIEEPPLHDERLIRQGAACYGELCLQCHGGPGAAPEPIGLAMQPLPGPLVDAPAHWRARELYWITRHGLKMTGMPAWQHRLSEGELWAVVAFVQRLPGYTPAAFEAALADGAGQCRGAAAVAATRPGDARIGRGTFHHYACNNCHVIPGVTGPDVQVGPPLAGMASRRLIAGVLPNGPEAMARWLRDPQGVDPQTAMPALGVSEQDARDMAAYLATLR